MLIAQANISNILELILTQPVGVGAAFAWDLLKKSHGRKSTISWLAGVPFLRGIVALAGLYDYDEVALSARESTEARSTTTGPHRAGLESEFMAMKQLVDFTTLYDMLHL
jgi:hypothetical protein